MAQSIRLVVLTKNLNFVESTTPPYTRYTFAQNKKLHVFCINIFYYSLCVFHTFLDGTNEATRRHFGIKLGGYWAKLTGSRHLGTIVLIDKRLRLISAYSSTYKQFLRARIS